jgi:hypothetical protein
MKLNHKILKLENRKDYGVKRDYRKIDFFVDGKYMGSTTWAKSLSEALNRYVKCDGDYFDVMGNDLIAKYSN